MIIKSYSSFAHCHYGNDAVFARYIRSLYTATFFSALFLYASSYDRVRSIRLLVLLIACRNYFRIQRGGVRWSRANVRGALRDTDFSSTRLLVREFMFREKYARRSDWSIGEICERVTRIVTIAPMWRGWREGSRVIFIFICFHALLCFATARHFSHHNTCANVKVVYSIPLTTRGPL